ncbi:MAG: hypothetical protein E7515_07920 [Ruminococcaceae bacterium]|jgi:hypothetical protein|nr:hypothetical protein [Oscillospiraceae bacterium]
MKNEKNLYKPFKPKTKVGSVIICLILIVPIIFFCVFSFVDKDKEISKDENRMLKQRPKFSYSELFKGKLTEDFNGYYSDQFPLRDFFVGINLKVNKLLTQHSGKDDIVIVDGAGKDDFHGEEAGNG